MPLAGGQIFIYRTDFSSATWYRRGRSQSGQFQTWSLSSRPGSPPCLHPWLLPSGVSSGPE